MITKTAANPVTLQNALLSTIRYSAAGLSLSELQQRHPGVARRTLQRWTQSWLKSGLIASDGQGRGRRYLSSRYGPHGISEPLSFSDKGDGNEAGHPFNVSTDSQDIVAHLSTPWQERPAVGYQRAFLDAYVPNQSAYLSPSLRYQLHNMGQPLEVEMPTGTFARSILDRLFIDLSWASSHLEGNTYTLLDTAKLIQRNQVAEGKSEFETLMILNHKSAIEFLVECTDDIKFDRYTTLNLHAVLSEYLLINPDDSGRIRKLQVGIGQCTYSPMLPGGLLDELFDVFLAKASLIEDPFEQSFFSLVHLPYLQPFIDVNKRTARLMANIPLLKADLCPLTFIGVPTRSLTTAMLGVYELNRIELLRDLYVHAYRLSVSEYLTLKRDLVAPDIRTRQYRLIVKDIVKEVVLRPDQAVLSVIDAQVAAQVAPDDQNDVRALIIQAVKELHEFKLVSYGLRPSELAAWKTGQVKL